MYWDGYGWAAPQAPTATATKKSSNGGKVALIVIGISVLLFAIGKCGSSDDKTSSSSSSSSRTSSRPFAAPSASAAPAEPATPTAAPAGSPVRDGKFEFRVLDMTRGKQAGDLSNQFEIVDAQGEFNILTMSVANIGDQAQSYFGANQKLIDTAGREYDANSTADMWMNSGTGDINPGNSIQVRAAFDVPRGTQPAELEVHDSMFSGGAKVRL
jgi:hypothetical protein